MSFHGVYLLRRAVKLDGLGVLVASGAGFLVFKWAMCVVLFGLVLKRFALFGRVPGAMQHTCIFCVGRRIVQMACIAFLALASADLLWVGCQGGPSSLLLPSKTSTVGF